MTVEVTSFEMPPEGYEYNPSEIVERKPMGNITKVVFADGSIEYRIFDSQVGFSVLKHKDGIGAERIFDQRQRELAQAAFNKLH